MARHTGAVCKLCRREGTKLFLKGSRCFSSKCAIEVRNFIPGQHGQGRSKLSEYGQQLREKQKLRRMYGVLEKQFRFYFSKAQKFRGVTGEKLLQILETRLDQVLYKSGTATAKSFSRQLIRHGNVLVNGHKVNIPAYNVRVGDTVEFRNSPEIRKIVKDNLEETKTREVPIWLKVNPEALKIEVLALPMRQDIQVPVSEQLIVELYSK